jgi:hypothetical protein
VKFKSGAKMEEQKKIRIIVILNHLKDVINPAYDNDIYQLWLKTDKKIKFRSWCIDKIKEMILQELDAPDLNSRSSDEDSLNKGYEVNQK